MSGDGSDSRPEPTGAVPPPRQPATTDVNRIAGVITKALVVIGSSAVLVMAGCCVGGTIWFKWMTTYAEFEVHNATDAPIDRIALVIRDREDAERVAWRVDSGVLESGEGVDFDRPPQTVGRYAIGSYRLEAWVTIDGTRYEFEDVVYIDGDEWGDRAVRIERTPTGLRVNGKAAARFQDSPEAPAPR